MSGVLIEVTSEDFKAVDFLGYEIYANVGDISGSDATVIAGASFNAVFEGNTFPHVGLTPGDIWYHWVRGAYGSWDSPTYSPLVKFGPTTAPPNNGEATAPAILGRDTAGTGPVEILSPATVKAMLGAGSAGGLAELDGGGKVPSSQLPAVSLAATDLTDYARSTWSPTDNSGGGLTFVVHQSEYVDMGSIVHVQGYIEWPSTADTHAVNISGLPFAAASFGCAAGVPNVATTAFGVVPVFVTGQQFLLLYRSDTNAAVTNAQMSAGYLLFSGFYFK